MIERPQRAFMKASACSHPSSSPLPAVCCVWRGRGRDMTEVSVCRSVYSRAGKPQEAASMCCLSCSRPMATTLNSSRSPQSWCWKYPSGTPSKRECSWGWGVSQLCHLSILCPPPQVLCSPNRKQEGPGSHPGCQARIRGSF